VRAALKRDSGLLGGLEFAWDSATGNPLRGAVYAKGVQDPVLSLEATDISYGTVPASTFDVPEPAGVKAHDVGGHGTSGHDTSGEPAHARKGSDHGKPVTGVARVGRKLGFKVSAPAQLEGRKREVVALVGHDKQHGAALVTYGRSLNGIAVVEKRVSGAPDSGNGPLAGAELPTVDINGATAQKLSTPLGTVIKFERGGISYTVIASAVPSVLEAAARGL
jgi:hypothetical protein